MTAGAYVTHHEMFLYLLTRQTGVLTSYVHGLIVWILLLKQKFTWLILILPMKLSMLQGIWFWYNDLMLIVAASWSPCWTTRFGTVILADGLCAHRGIPLVQSWLPLWDIVSIALHTCHTINVRFGAVNRKLAWMMIWLFVTVLLSPWQFSDMNLLKTVILRCHSLKTMRSTTMRLYFKILVLFVSLLHFHHMFDNIAVILYMEHLQMSSYQCRANALAIQLAFLINGYCRLACHFCSMRTRSMTKAMQKWNGWHGIYAPTLVAQVKNHVVSNLTLSNTCGYKIYSSSGMINGYPTLTHRSMWLNPCLRKRPMKDTSEGYLLCRVRYLNMYQFWLPPSLPPRWGDACRIWPAFYLNLACHPSSFRCCALNEFAMIELVVLKLPVKRFHCKVLLMRQRVTMSVSMYLPALIPVYRFYNWKRDVNLHSTLMHRFLSRFYTILGSA